MDKWLVDSKKEKRIPEPIKPSLVAVIGNGKPKANYCHDQEKPGEWGEPSTSCGTETEQTCENDFAAIPSLETKKKKIGNPKKREKKTGFVLSWINNPKFKNWLEKSSKPASRGTAFAFCKVCNLDVVAHKTVLIKHSNSEKHKLNWQKVSTSTKITELFTEKSEEIAVRNAEIKLSALLATNQLPFLLMDTSTPLLKIIFPDSKIAQKLNLKRTKATAIVCNSLGNNFLLDLHYKLREAGFFFSLIMDETTDISIKKQCAFSIIFYDNSVNQIKTNFFDLVEANGSTAVDLFDILKSSLTSKKIPLTNLVGFSSDTTNVMVGEHNSVFALLKKELPQIICIRCSCHMAHLAISKACLKLPRQVEDLLRNVGSHFNRSSLRRKKFEEFQNFFHVEIHKILSPAITRWLSIKACIDRVLEQYEPLKHYLMESVREDPSHTTDSMLGAMTNPFTRVYLEFMSYTLGLMTDFNLLFQSERPLLHRVKPETKALLETLYANFLELLPIKKAKDIFKLNHENPDFFLPLENIYLGIAATESFAELNKNPNIQRHDIVKFSTSILSFCKKHKRKIQFSRPYF